MASNRFRAPKGMIDLYGDALAAHRRIEDAAERLFGRYGCAEMRPTLLEDTALYAHSTGETSEIVERQMFVVKRESADYALRPEGTPSVVRAYLQGKMYQPGAVNRFWYCGPMYRYERMQKARLRQFHQVGVEVLGTADPLIDAEVIQLGAAFYEEVGLHGVRVKLNTLGDAACRPAFRAALLAYQQEHREALCAACQDRMERNPLRFLDCKAPGCKELRVLAPLLEPCDDCREHFDEVRRLLDATGTEYVLDPTLVRGLDYYGRTIFEFCHSALGARDAVGGGGRYDALMKELGGPDVPAIGFALGVEATLIALQDNGADPVTAAPLVDLHIVAPPGTDRAGLFSLLTACRAAGVTTDIGPYGRSVKGQMRSADAGGARHVAVVGENELTTGRCRLKTMATGEERDVALVDLPNALDA